MKKWVLFIKYLLWYLTASRKQFSFTKYSISNYLFSFALPWLIKNSLMVKTMYFWLINAPWSWATRMVGHSICHTLMLLEVICCPVTEFWPMVWEKKSCTSFPDLALKNLLCNILLFPQMAVEQREVWRLRGGIVWIAKWLAVADLTTHFDFSKTYRTVIWAINKLLWDTHS